MSNDPPDPAARSVASLGDLLDALDLGSSAALEELVYDSTELDGWIDWDLCDDASITVCVNSRGIGLRYPFTVTEFFTILDEADDLAEADIENEP